MTQKGVSQSESPTTTQRRVFQSEGPAITQKGISQSESSTMTRGGVSQPVVSMSREDQYKYFEILVELKRWLQKGPLDGSINKGKSLVRGIRKHLMIPGVEEKFLNLGIWQFWLKVSAIIQEMIGQGKGGEWYVALTHEARWRQNEAKDALFSVINPGDSRTVNEDIICSH